MGLKRTQGQKRNCKKGTRKQQNKRTGKRKTAKKNLRRKRQTKRRLKGGAGKRNREEPESEVNGPNVENIPKNSPPVKKRENMNKKRRFSVTHSNGEAQLGYSEIQEANNNLKYSNEHSDKKNPEDPLNKLIGTSRPPFTSYSPLSKRAKMMLYNNNEALRYDPNEEF